jgi:hypothetical protein
MKVLFGLIFLIAGILGIARGAMDSPSQNLGEMIGTGPGVASVVPLAAAFFLVGGLLILAKARKFSLEGYGDPARTDACNASPAFQTADVSSANENS